VYKAQNKTDLNWTKILVQLRSRTKRQLVYFISFFSFW